MTSGPAVMEASVESGPLRLLLVDDNAGELHLLKPCLQETEFADCILMWVATAEEGLDRIRQGECDLCLLDYHLTGASGLEFLQAAAAEALDVPIIVLTIDEDPSVDLQAMRLGADDVLLKRGLRAETLAGGIRHALERRRLSQALRLEHSRLQLLHEIAGVADRAETSDSALRDALGILCRYWGAAVGHAVEVDAQARVGETGIWHLDPDVDPGMVEALSIQRGYPHRGLAGRVFWSSRAVVVPDLQRDCFMSRRDRCVAWGLRSAFAFPVLLRGEVVYIVEFFCRSDAPLMGDAERLLQDIGVQLGRIVERQKAADRLAQSEQRYRNLYNSATDLLLTVDPSGKILAANERSRELLGLEPQELVGRNLRDLTVPAESPREEAALAQLFAVDNASSKIELSLSPRSGDPVPVEIGRRLEAGQQHDPEIHLVVRDIADRLRAEQELREAQKIEAVGRLAGGVAHDFNNMLSVITGYSEILLGELEEEHPHRRWLSQIHQAAERAAELTRQLLALGRRSLLNPTVLSLNELLMEISPLMRGGTPESIRIDYELAEDLDPVECDRSRLQQVLTNLFVNAREAMPDGGSILIRTCNWRPGEDRTYVPDALAHRPLVLLQMLDSGEGLEGKEVDRLFEPFYSTRKASGSSGLGLSTSLGLVQQSGGQMLLQPRPGGGSIVTVALPAIDTES